jgi:Cu/Ag efflux pump CusA
VFTQSFQWAYREIRYTTAWGMPNVVSVPIDALPDVSETR